MTPFLFVFIKYVFKQHFFFILHEVNIPVWATIYNPLSQSYEFDPICLINYYKGLYFLHLIACLC